MYSLSINISSGLIQYQHLAARERGASETDQLSLSRGQVPPSVPHLGIEPGGHLAYHVT